MKALILILLLLPGALLAQQAPAPAGCDTPEHRQFDFWLGEWDVTQAGQPAGKNHIESHHSGCVLAENWVSATAGFSGRSINVFDRSTGQWHQTWADSSGLLLKLDGGLVDGSMVLTGFVTGPDGERQFNRISWTPNDDGSVRQHWEVSTDEKSWATAFDGLYQRRGETD